MNGPIDPGFHACPRCECGGSIANLQRALAETTARATAAEEEMVTHRAARASAEVRAERAEADCDAFAAKLGETILERDAVRRELEGLRDAIAQLAARYGCRL